MYILNGMYLFLINIRYIVTQIYIISLEYHVQILLIKLLDKFYIFLYEKIPVW